MAWAFALSGVALAVLLLALARAAQAGLLSSAGRSALERQFEVEEDAAAVVVVADQGALSLPRIAFGDGDRFDLGQERPAFLAQTDQRVSSGR